MHRFGLVLVLSVLPALTQTTNPNARLLFNQGFGTNTYRDPDRGGAYDDWPRFHGTGTACGISSEAPIFNAGLLTLLQTLTAYSTHPGPGNSAEYIQTALETVVGPYGNSTKGLKMQILKP